MLKCVWIHHNENEMKLSSASDGPHQSWAVNDEWWRGMVFHWVRRNAPLPSTVPTSHFFWQIVCEAFTTDAHIAKIISAKLPLWPARRTRQASPCITLSSRIFPGQCKLWQIPSSCIMRFPANLPNSRESGRVSLFQLRGMLSDWMMLKLRPSSSPFCLPSQLWPFRLFCLFVFVPVFVWGSQSPADKKSTTFTSTQVHIFI